MLLKRSKVHTQPSKYYTIEKSDLPFITSLQSIYICYFPGSIALVRGIQDHNVHLVVVDRLEIAEDDRDQHVEGNKSEVGQIKNKH